MSQTELAGKLGVSFATVNRWEKGRCEPSQIAMSAIKRLCEEHKIDFRRYEGDTIVYSDNVLTLYHGSKEGINGPIAPVSRQQCDFGQGFYMGTDKSQALTLICDRKAAKLYTLKLDLKGLKILDIGVGIDWALLLAYNRGKMEPFRNEPIYKRISEMADGCDMAVGYIADDRMFIVLDRFFGGEITDEALIKSLSALKLGKQYVALTEKACRQIEITDIKTLSEKEAKQLKKESDERRAKGIALANEICHKYRREGRFFDEIIKAGD